MTKLLPRSLLSSHEFHANLSLCSLMSHRLIVVQNIEQQCLLVHTPLLRASHATSGRDLNKFKTTPDHLMSTLGVSLIVTRNFRTCLQVESLLPAWSQVIANVSPPPPPRTDSPLVVPPDRLSSLLLSRPGLSHRWGSPEPDRTISLGRNCQGTVAGLRFTMSRCACPLFWRGRSPVRTQQCSPTRSSSRDSQASVVSWLGSRASKRSTSWSPDLSDSTNLSWSVLIDMTMELSHSGQPASSSVPRGRHQPFCSSKK